MPRDTARSFAIGFFACLFLLAGIKYVQAQIIASETEIDGPYAMEYFERCVEVTSRVYSQASEAKLDQLRENCEKVATKYARARAKTKAG